CGDEDGGAAVVREVASAAKWWWRGGGASEGEWHRGPDRSGDEDQFWFWLEHSPEKFFGGGGMVASDESWPEKGAAAGNV
ncbi:hypothetical protein Tco_1497312, partial [Tanacetum coccineum]